MFPNSASLICRHSLGYNPLKINDSLHFYLPYLLLPPPHTHTKKWILGNTALSVRGTESGSMLTGVNPLMFPKIPQQSLCTVTDTQQEGM